MGYLRKTLWHIIPIVLLFPLFINAQDIKVTASVSRNKVYLDQTFELTITFKGTRNFPSFRLPGLKDFSVISGPSQSSNYQVINGRVSSSQSYTWILAPLRTGMLTIPVFSVNIDGREYSTKAIRIQVLSGSSKPRAKAPSGRPAVPEKAEDYVFLKAIPSKTRVYQGEEILVDYVLYARKTPRNFSITSMPKAVGFWIEEFPTPQNPSLETEIRNGVRYQKANIQKIALFPTRSGELILDPIQVVTQIELPVNSKRRSWFDDFFNDPFFDSPFNLRLVNKNVIPEPITFKVLPLPEKGKPDDFTGAVGQYTLKASLDTNVVNQGDAFSLKITIQGWGNAKLFTLPELQMPRNFEVFSPQTTQDSRRKNGHIYAMKTAEYVVIPREAGKFHLPNVKFSYFDPSLERYVNLQGQDLSVTVNPVEGKMMLQGSGFSRREIALLNSDIRFIKTKTDRWIEKDGGILNSLFLVNLIFSLFLVSGSLGYKKWKDKINADSAAIRRRNAYRIAREHLLKAQEAIENGNLREALRESLACISGFIADRNNLPPSGLSSDELIGKIEEKVNSTLLEELSAFLRQNEELYFSPGTLNEAQLNEIFQNCEKLLSELRDAL